MLLSFLKRIHEMKGVRLPSLRISMKNPFHTDLCWFGPAIRYMFHDYYRIHIIHFFIPNRRYFKFVQLLELRKSFLIFFWTVLCSFFSFIFSSWVIFLCRFSVRIPHKKKTEPCTEETFPFPRQAFIFIQLYELIIMCFHVWLQQSCIELKWPASSASKTKRKCQKSVLIFKRNIKHIPTQTMDFHKMLNGIFFMNRGLFASFQLWKRKFPPSEMVPLKPILIQFGPIEMHWINFRIIVSSRSDSLVIFCMVIFKYHVRI